MIPMRSSPSCSRSGMCEAVELTSTTPRRNRASSYLPVVFQSCLVDGKRRSKSRASHNNRRAPWQEVCEYTDDDVHYLEIEQSWTGGLLLQRQIMLIRDDRCVLFADAVLPRCETTEAEAAQPGLEDSAAGRRRIDSLYEPDSARGDASKPIQKRKPRKSCSPRDADASMVLPLAASEWRVGATTCTLSATEDQHLAITIQGRDRLYAPLWFDLQPRRLKRKRTWRQLTIADQLRIVGTDQAVGYRIQVGPEQWMVYRSLADHSWPYGARQAFDRGLLLFQI